MEQIPTLPLPPTWALALLATLTLCLVTMLVRRWIRRAYELGRWDGLREARQDVIDALVEEASRTESSRPQ